MHRFGPVTIETVPAVHSDSARPAQPGRAPTPSATCSPATDGRRLLRRRHRPVRRDGRPGADRRRPRADRRVGRDRRRAATSTRAPRSRPPACSSRGLVVPVHWGTYSPIARAPRAAAVAGPSGRGVRRATSGAAGLGRPPAPARAGRPPRRARRPGPTPVPRDHDRPTRSRAAAERPAARWPASSWRARRRRRCWLAVALWVLAWILPGFTIDGRADALLAGFVIGVLNADRLAGAGVRPRPDLGAHARDRGDRHRRARRVVAARLAARRRARRLLDRPRHRHRPGGHVTRIVTSPCWRSTTTPGSTTRSRRWPAGGASGPTATDVPGIVFVQLDGVAKVGAANGRCAPATSPRSTAGCTTVRTAWSAGTTGWSSQTGVSQCGILHGSTNDMPAFRWVDKATGEVVVSNRPAVGGGDRAGPLRRQRAAGPPRLELREPVLRRRRAGRC